MSLKDALLTLQASVTKTSSFNSTGLNVPGGVATVNNPMKAEILVTAYSSGTANSTAVFTIEHSDDNNTWYLLASGADQTLTMTSTAQHTTVDIPVVTSKPYIRLVLTITPGGSATPSITYQGYLVQTNP